MRKGYRGRGRKKRRCSSLLFLFFCVFLLTVSVFWWAERQLLPPLREIARMQTKSIANDIIDRAAEDVLREMQLSAGNLLLRGDDGGLPSYTADTAQINRFCTLLSRSASQSLSALPKEAVRIPLGAASRIARFANSGPEIAFTLLPQGAANVDYETAFESVGINQINYKIWVNISVEMKIVNPLYQETLSMQRKIMLADLVFGGKVPEHYFQIEQGERNIY